MLHIRDWFYLLRKYITNWAILTRSLKDRLTRHWPTFFAPCSVCHTLRWCSAFWLALVFKGQSTLRQMLFSNLPFIQWVWRDGRRSSQVCVLGHSKWAHVDNRDKCKSQRHKQILVLMIKINLKKKEDAAATTIGRRQWPVRVLLQCHFTIWQYDVMQHSAQDTKMPQKEMCQDSFIVHTFTVLI